MDGRGILNEYVLGLSDHDATCFRRELSSVADMFDNGEIVEEKFREIAGATLWCYTGGASPEKP